MWPIVVKLLPATVGVKVVRIVFGALLFVALIASNLTSDVEAAEDLDYKPACKQLQNAWLELHKLPANETRSSDKQYIREILERLYREQSNDQKANFAILSSDDELADAISKVAKNEITELPTLGAKPAYRVTKSPKGTFTFTPTYGCTGAFSVPEGSRHYSDAIKHVGKIQVGQVKVVSEPIFDKWLTGDERVVMPDVE